MLSREFPLSSTLARASYDDEKQALTVSFKTGTTYRYAGVPPDIADGLFSAPSAGSYHASMIRGQFQHTRL